MTPDRKPPRFHGDERQTLMELLCFQRESIVRKVQDLDDVSARRRLVPSETSLWWLVVHLSRAESSWVLERFGGLAGVDPVDSHASLATAVESYRSVWRAVDAVVADTDDLAQCCADPDYASTPLRWVLAHLLEETARHAGHADILRELIDGQTGR